MLSEIWLWVQSNSVCLCVFKCWLCLWEMVGSLHCQCAAATSLVLQNNLKVQYIRQKGNPTTETIGHITGNDTKRQNYTE